MILEPKWIVAQESRTDKMDFLHSLGRGWQGLRIRFSS